MQLWVFQILVTQAVSKWAKTFTEKFHGQNSNQSVVRGFFFMYEVQSNFVMVFYILVTLAVSRSMVKILIKMGQNF